MFPWIISLLIVALMAAAVWFWRASSGRELARVYEHLSGSWFREPRHPALEALSLDDFKLEATRVGETALEEWNALSDLVRPLRGRREGPELEALLGQLWDLHMIAQDAKTYRNAGSGTEAIWQELRQRFLESLKQVTASLDSLLARHAGQK